MNPFANGISLDLVLDILKRRFWVVLSLFSAILTAVVSFVTFLPNIYTSSAFVLVEGQQIPERFVNSTVVMGVERRLQVISQEILSRDRLMQMVEQFDLYPDLQQRGASEDRIASAMRRDIGVNITGRPSGMGGDTVAFEVSYTNPDPQNTKEVTNLLASFYIEQNLKVREAQAQGTSEFLRYELEKAKKNLEEQERQVTQYKQQYMGELPEQLNANLSTFSMLQKQLEILSESLAKAQERRSLLVRRTVETGATASENASDPNFAPLQIETLRRTLVQLKTRFSDKHPDVIRLKQQIAAREEELKSQTEILQSRQSDASIAAPITSPSMQLELMAIDREIQWLSTDLGKVRNDLTIYQQRLEKTPRREQEMLTISRDYSATRDLYFSLLKRLDEAQLADSLEQRQKAERFRLLEPASYPNQPAAPNRKRLLLIGLILSLGAAAGGALLWELLDTSFHRLEDVKAFSKAPVLISIPRIVTEADQLQQRRRQYLGAAALAVSLFVLIGASYWVAAGNKQLVRLFVPPASGGQLRQ